MIPLRDINPRTTVPFISVFLILVNSLVWLFQVSLGPVQGERFIFAMGLVPARIDIALTTHAVSLGGALLPLFTSMFLHGGWLHVIGNMWFLWVFGDNVEDRLGHLTYLFFYILCGLGAGLIHTVLNWGSMVPTVGASGAISGVMGAYLLMFPHSKVITLVPLIVFWFTVRLPAYFFVGYWIVLQVIGGLGALGMRSQGGIAFWAHIGGFFVGVALAATLRQRPSEPYGYG